MAVEAEAFEEGDPLQATVALDGCDLDVTVKAGRGEMLEKAKAIGRCGVIVGGGGDEEMRCHQWRWRQRGDATLVAAKATRRCGVGGGGGGNEWMQLHWRRRLVCGCLMHDLR